MRRSIAALVTLGALVVVAVATAAAFPPRIELPNGWQPEGIAAGQGNTLYVGSIPTGAVRKVNARTGQSRTFVSAREGRAAIGLKAVGRRLFVAGGPTGKAFVYSTRTGRPVADFQLAPAGEGTFVNDVAVTREAAYFTDSRQQVLHVLPRDLSAARDLPLPDIPAQEGFNLNGIVATPDGGTLIVVQSNAGLLWRIDAASGRATQIDLGGATVTNGDGLLLTGRTLYVVRNELNRIAVIRLAGDLSRGSIKREITSTAFDVPTTIARLRGRLYAVNARFGTDPKPSTEYWITRVRR